MDANKVGGGSMKSAKELFPVELPQKNLGTVKLEFHLH